MSIIRTVTRKSLESITPELLSQAIGSRLSTLAARYCPGDEETPQQILARLKIEPQGRDAFGEWYLKYAATGRAISVERFVGKAWEADRRKLFDEIAAGEDDAGSKRVRALLSDAKESVVFDLSESDLRGMGLPVCIAGAVALAKAGDGLVRVEGEGWIEAKGQDVETVLSFV